MSGSPDCVDGIVSGRPRTDDTLIQRYRLGDEDAAASLYLRYAPRLRALARKHCTPVYAGRFDADDVVQSVFQTFFHGVRREAYAVPPDGEIWALLIVLALNKVRNLVDFHSADKRAAQHTASAFDLDAVLAADETSAAFLRMVLDEQMDGLPEASRKIIQMRIEGYEVGEIAERTNRSRRTVERTLHDFRNCLAAS